MLRTIANEIGDEAIEISSSETVSDEEGEYGDMRAKVRHNPVGQSTDARKEVRTTCNRSLKDFRCLRLLWFSAKMKILPSFSAFLQEMLVEMPWEYSEHPLFSRVFASLPIAILVEKSGNVGILSLGCH